MAPKKIKGKSLTEAYRPKLKGRGTSKRKKTVGSSGAKNLASTKRGQSKVDLTLIQLWAGFAFITAVGLFLLFSNARKEKLNQQVQLTPQQTLEHAEKSLPVQAPEVVSIDPIEQKLEELASKPFSERVHFWSFALKQNPALLKELESRFSSADTVPIISDRYDCTSYVETVYALSRSSTIDHIGSEIAQIRYQPGSEETRDFASRNHFMETQWVPANIEKGIFKDYTKTFTDNLKIKTASVSKTINQRQWFSAWKKASENQGRSIASEGSLGGSFGLGITQNLAALPENIPQQFQDGIQSKIHYVPVERFGANRVKLIPDGAVVNFVRSPKDSQPVVITHQGIVLQTPQGTVLRHASAKEGIREEPLLEYMQNQSKRRWKLLGIQILSEK